MAFRSIRFAIFAASLVFAATAHADTAPDPWASWSDSFTSTMTACAAAAQTGCLAKAFHRQCASRRRQRCAGG